MELIPWPRKKYKEPRDLRTIGSIRYIPTNGRKLLEVKPKEVRLYLFSLVLVYSI